MTGFPVTDEAVDAAAESLYNGLTAPNFPGDYRQQSETIRGHWRADARAALEAAARTAQPAPALAALDREALLAIHRDHHLADTRWLGQSRTEIECVCGTKIIAEGGVITPVDHIEAHRVDAILALVPQPICICRPHWVAVDEMDGRDPNPNCPVHPQLVATREKLTEALTGVQIDGENGSAIIEESEAAQLADRVLASGVVQEAPAQHVSEAARSDTPSTPVVDRKMARSVIERALTARHEELSGEASPRDFDGASQILNALLAAGVFQSEADVRAGELEKTADEFGVDISANDDEWFKGYRQAQRDILIRLADRAAAIRAGGTNG
ncbi:hypothetical protein [Kribbella deserti]|uniref:DUF222 domain-containing protein n=1 Tax=Kribbella deserti TaxID=1926257 RepID=A0ABV6QR84_9ACTN